MLPPFSTGLQEESEGASAATSSTQEVTPIAAIAASTSETGADDDQRLAAGATAAPAASAIRWLIVEKGTQRPVVAQACVSSVERLWTTPSTRSWLGITTAVPSPGFR